MTEKERYQVRASAVAKAISRLPPEEQERLYGIMTVFMDVVLLEAVEELAKSGQIAIDRLPESVRKRLSYLQNAAS